MSLLTLVLVALVAYMFGYHARTIANRIKRLERLLNSPKQIAAPNRPTGTIFDGDDPALVAKHEFEERFERMNPHIKGNDGDK